MRYEAGNRVISPAAVVLGAAAAIIVLFIAAWPAIKYRSPDWHKVAITEYTVDVCAELGVPSALPLSVFLVESSLWKRHMTFKKWEARHRFYVYSVPQISYNTAYGDGFRGEPDELMDYTVAIYWAVRHMKTLMYVYDGDICKVIMAYNAGDCVSGNYGYLDKVLKIYRTYYPLFECGK